MSDKPFKQTEKTKDFVKKVNDLINKAVVKNQAEVVAQLNWEKTQMSNVMNGRRNIPNDVYKKFTENYQPIGIANHKELAIKLALENQSINVVLLRALAEVLSKQRGESLIKTLGDLEAAVRQEQKALLDKLQQ